MGTEAHGSKSGGSLIVIVVIVTVNCIHVTIILLRLLLALIFLLAVVCLTAPIFVKAEQALLIGRNK